MYEIYVVTNQINGKKYVGQTCSGISQRWAAHKSSAKRGYDTFFARALRKYGIENFGVEVVETISTVEEANDCEAQWIARFNSTNDDFGYNSTFGGGCAPRTERAKRKLSQIKKKMFEDPEFKAKMTAASVGKHHTEEGKANIAKALEGNQYRTGIPHDEESKNKISLALKKAFAEGRRTKSGGLKKGTILGPMPEEEKLKRSLGMKRHVRTPEHEAKRRASLAATQARKREIKALDELFNKTA